jgi:hypothetical protein
MSSILNMKIRPFTLLLLQGLWSVPNPEGSGMYGRRLTYNETV